MNTKSGKKRGPKPSVKKRDKAKVRGITASDVEWKWVTEQAKEKGISTSAFVRSLIQREMRSL